MLILYAALIGLFAFTTGTWIFGAWLRRNPSRENAENSSRIMHFLFFTGLGIPFLTAVITTGLTYLDELVGLQPLPWKPFFFFGILVALPGLYYLGISNKNLRLSGYGGNAFRITRQIVMEDVYKRTRNPMSLGTYLFALALGFGSGSTFVTLIVLFVVIPSHIFFLKYFEEFELELRFGETYLKYKERVPFLIPKFKQSS